MAYGVFSDEGLLEGEFGEKEYAEAAVAKYNAELVSEGYTPSCYVDEYCEECEASADACTCNEDEDEDEDDE